MATGPGPLYVMQAPPMAPPSVSLLTAVPVFTHEESDMRWANGFRWAPEGSGNDSVGVFDPCSDGAVNKDVVLPPAVEEFCSFVIWAADDASSFGHDARDYQGRARRKLLAGQSKLIEHEAYVNSLDLCYQPIALAAGNDNFIDVTPAAGAVSPRVALAVLEDVLGDRGVGQQAVLHCRPYELVPWGETHGLQWQDNWDGKGHNRWVTATENVIAVGRGYTGQSPTAAAATADKVWVYATSMLNVHLGPVEVVPTEDSQAMARTTNLITYYAERLVVVAWEHAVHIGIEVDRTKY